MFIKSYELVVHDISEALQRVLHMLLQLGLHLQVFILVQRKFLIQIYALFLALANTLLRLAELLLQLIEAGVGSIKVRQRLLQDVN